MSLQLRPLEQADFVLLHNWLNRPHLRPFYMQRAVSMDYVSKKFAPRLDGDHATKCVIAAENEQPFGYMQWYLNRSFPEYGAAVIGRMDGVSIDYFIGDEGFIGRRLGASMLSALVMQTRSNLEAKDRIFHIAHGNENLRAIACTKRAGFVADREFVENETRSTLFVRNETQP